jgi:1-deoxy-D-xylulose-5-phosphate reductoisomerase
LNAANEVAVDAFLKERIGFLEIPDVIEKTLGKSTFIKTPTLEDYNQTDLLARQVAEEIIK